MSAPTPPTPLPLAKVGEPRNPSEITHPGLKAARTVPRMEDILRSELRNNLGHSVDVRLGGEHSNPKTVAEVGQGLLDMSQRYPGTPYDSLWVSAEVPKGVYAESLVDTGVIIFSAEMLARHGRLDLAASLENDVKQGHRLPGGVSTPMGIAVHEAAHFVDMGLAVYGWKETGKLAAYPHTLKQGVGRVIAGELGKSEVRTSDVAAMLGSYATHRGHGLAESSADGKLPRELLELVAEALPDTHMNGHHSQKANRYVVARLDDAVLEPGPRYAPTPGWELARDAVLDRRRIEAQDQRMMSAVAAGVTALDHRHRVQPATTSHPLGQSSAARQEVRQRPGHDAAPGRRLDLSP